MKHASIGVGLLLLAAPASAADITGTWVGRYECAGGVRSLMLEIEAPAAHDNTATFMFSGEGVAGMYSMVGKYDSDRNELTLRPEGWLYQPQGYAMVGIEGSLEADQIIGRIADAYCGPLTLSRLGGSSVPGPTDAASGAGEVVSRGTAGSQLAPFVALADQNQSAKPGSQTYPYAGNWAIDIPGGVGIWTTSVERDFARMIETRTDSLTRSSVASNAGALQINENGRYRIAWLGGKWQGEWEPNDDARFPGSVLLKHPHDSDNDWIVFRNGEGRMEAWKYPYIGLSANHMHPIQNSAVAEYMLAVQDASSLVGDWELHEGGYVGGSLSLSPDGRYRLTDSLMNRTAEGKWRSEGEYLTLLRGHWGDGDAYVRFGSPGQTTVISGGSEWTGVRR